MAAGAAAGTAAGAEAGTAAGAATRTAAGAAAGAAAAALLKRRAGCFPGLARELPRCADLRREPLGPRASELMVSLQQAAAAQHHIRKIDPSRSSCCVAK